MSQVINFYGGPGTGKSTTMARTFVAMKDAGLSVEMVHEWVKLPVWAGETHVLDDQLYILAKQNHALRRLNGQVKFILTDAPLLMSLVYSQRRAVHEIAKACATEYENTHVFLRRVKPYQTGGRTQNERQARELDDKISYMLTHNVGDFHLLDADEGAAAEVMKVWA